MAQFDFSALKPATTDMTPRRTGRAPAENPFLTNDWVLKSYESGTAFAVEVPGEWVSYTRTGKNPGPATKLSGDAVSAVTMIRKAAEELGIGVRIEYGESKKKGHVQIKFLGTVRKQRRTADDEGTDE